MLIDNYDNMCVFKTPFYHILHECPQNVSWIILILITFYEFGDVKVLSGVKCHFKYTHVIINLQCNYRVMIIRISSGEQLPTPSSQPATPLFGNTQQRLILKYQHVNVYQKQSRVSIATNQFSYDWHIQHTFPQIPYIHMKNKIICFTFPIYNILIFKTQQLLLNVTVKHIIKLLAFGRHELKLFIHI